MTKKNKLPLAAANKALANRLKEVFAQLRLTERQVDTLNARLRDADGELARRRAQPMIAIVDHQAALKEASGMRERAVAEAWAEARKECDAKLAAVPHADAETMHGMAMALRDLAGLLREGVKMGSPMQVTRVYQGAK